MVRFKAPQREHIVYMRLLAQRRRRAKRHVRRGGLIYLFPRPLCQIGEIDSNTLQRRYIGIELFKDIEAWKPGRLATRRVSQRIAILDPDITGRPPTGGHFEVLQRFTGSGFTVQGYHFFVSITRRPIL